MTAGRMTAVISGGPATLLPQDDDLSGQCAALAAGLPAAGATP